MSDALQEMKAVSMSDECSVPCVTAIDDLVSTVFDKGALQLRTRQTLSDNFTFQGTSFNHGNPFVIRGQTSLPLLVSAKRWTNWKNNRTKIIALGKDDW